MFKFLQSFLVIFVLIVSYGTNAKNSITFEAPTIESKTGERATFLLLPIPNQEISLDNQFFLRENNKAIEATFRVINIWPGKKNSQYIRLLSIEIAPFQYYSKPLTLNWLRSDILQTLHQNYAIDRSDNHLVFPSNSWLAQSILLHPDTAADNTWYTAPQKKYAYYITNQSLLSQKGYPRHKASQWLYDRPQALFQLYIMTGEVEWLIKADDVASFYTSNIDDTGVFILKKRFDPKLLMPKGVLYQYLLRGNSEAKQALQRMFERSYDWDEKYTLRRGFWTERNQAAALNVAVSYWELTNDDSALERINDIIDATVKMTFSPGNGWSLRGCPQHGFKSHEGWGDDSPTCSPWMMALLGDALWRFYQLTGDKRSASLIDAFGDFIINHGIYYGDKRVKNIVIPKYIVSITNPKQEELNQWTDPQHNCDVAALLGKSAYIKRKNNRDDFLVKTLFSTFLEQCIENYTRLKNSQKNKREKSHWVIKPPRRFGWMYSTTSDLPWLKHELLGDY